MNPKPGSDETKKELSADKLAHQLKCFVYKSCSQLIENPTIPDQIEPRTSFVHLNLDDKKIAEKEDIKSTNGKYYFSNPNIWKSYYIPNADSPGVYLFFNKDNQAIYVGKSEAALGKRVVAHVGTCVDDCFPNLAFPTADYIITIAFDAAPFLAPAFESYLLAKYSFEHNTAGQ